MGPCYIRYKDRFGVVALITKPLSSSTAAEAVREGGRLVLPVIGFGVAIAILYFGRVFFITSLSAMIIAFILEPFVALLMRIRWTKVAQRRIGPIKIEIFLYLAR